MKEKGNKPSSTADVLPCSLVKSVDKQSTSKLYSRPTFIQQFRECTGGKLWWSIFIVLMIATVSVRFYKIHYPDQVCWDETHFGRFSNQYIQRTFFFDVHPPLGKMLTGLFGYLDGYDGSFIFEVGKKYNDTPYMGMRIGCAIMGALVVPLSFLTVWESTLSLPAATFTALTLILDNSLVTLNRYILLDPIMLFFISATVFSMNRFSHQKRYFSVRWWFWLSSTGFFMTGSFAVKFVGLFAVLLVGVRAIYELWVILGDMSQPVTYTVKHFLARALCLIVLPVALYLTIFYVHLTILENGGEEDEFFSSAFQVSLKGNMFNEASGPKDVAYGAEIRLKNNVIEGQYLHSHKSLYPVGARQQQITMVYIRDRNNQWVIKRHDQPSPPWNSTDPIDFVRNGDLVRIEHKTTRRNLHVYRGPAPVSDKMYQVTGYGQKGVGDEDDIWRIEVEGGTKGEIIEIVRHSFRLIHNNFKCVLTTTDKIYPEWGFGQTEVACNPKYFDSRAVWHIDDNIHPRLPNISYQIYELSFLERFIESHKLMLLGNAGFKPKLSDFQSRPWMWPLNLRGQFFSVKEVVIYLLGNPFIWWGHCLFFLIYFGISVVNRVIKKRGVVLSQRQIALQKRTMDTAKWIFIGFFLHYAPFWPMCRILYIHHYFPAHLFSNMLSGVILDYVLETLSDRFSARIYTFSVVALLLAYFYGFYLFFPLTYGFPNRPSTLNDSAMYGRRWIPTWEF